MSIQSEIERINLNISNSYSAVSEMGGTIPTEQNSNNLAGAVRSIPQGTQFSVDDTLKMSEDNVLSVTTPVKFILTQEEFDALSDDEKNSGLYVIAGESDESDSTDGISQEEFDEAINSIESELNGLNSQVKKVATSSDDVLNSMYQKPTHTQYVTAGNFVDGFAGNITEKTVSELLGSNLPTNMSFVINGVTVGTYTANTVLFTILDDINSNETDGVTVSYSQTSNDFTFTATNPGGSGQIDFGEGLADSMFGVSGSNNAVPKFGNAYGVPWMGNSNVKFRVDGMSGVLTISGGGTIEDVATRLNEHITNAGKTAFYNKYTGQLDIKDNNGGKVDFEVTFDDEDYGTIKLEFDNDYAPNISYTEGQDTIFIEVKVNGKTQTQSGKTLNLSIDAPTKEYVDNLVTEKQDKLVGTEGQVVGFDADGNAVAQNALSSGLTKEQADALYIHSDGGTEIRAYEYKAKTYFSPGTIQFSASKEYEGTDYASITIKEDKVQLYYDYYDSNNEFVTNSTLTLNKDGVNISKLVDPETDEMPVSKGYVDTVISNASGVPSGVIVMWSGATAPDGWAICDGTNGTPDLRGRFVLGKSSNYSIGETGGESTVKLTIDELPYHVHTENVSYNNSEQRMTLSSSGSGAWATYKIDVTYSGAKSATYVSTSGAGNDMPHNNMPPYYVLAYIMKL